MKVRELINMLAIHAGMDGEVRMEIMYGDSSCKCKISGNIQYSQTGKKNCSIVLIGNADSHECFELGARKGEKVAR